MTAKEWPADEVLREWAKTMTWRQIGDAVYAANGGTWRPSRQTVSHKMRSLGEPSRDVPEDRRFSGRHRYALISIRLDEDQARLEAMMTRRDWFTRPTKQHPKGLPDIRRGVREAIREYLERHEYD